MLLLSKEDIRSVFSMRDAVEADKLAFQLVTQNRCQAPQRIHLPVPEHEGCFLFMPAYAPELGSASLKIYDFFPHNAARGGETSAAQVLLMDAKTGAFRALLDGSCLTQLRTGAASGAAFDVLGRKDARTGALIGTGAQAAAQLEAMLTVRPLEEVKLYSRNRDRLCRFAEEMRRELAAYGARLVPASSADEAIENADLIITATPSPTPVFNGTKVKPGATISCVGAYQHHMQELDPAALIRADKLYFDSRAAVLAESGDILIPLEQGLITEDDFTGELGQVLLGEIRGRESEDEIIIFETVGVAAQDLVAAQRIYERALAAQAGQRWGE